MRINLAMPEGELTLRVFWHHYKDDEGKQMNKTTCFIVDGTIGADIYDENHNVKYYTLGCVGSDKTKKPLVKAINRKRSFEKAINRLFPDNHELRAECWKQAYESGVHFTPRNRTKQNAVKYRAAVMVDDAFSRHAAEEQTLFIL